MFFSRVACRATSRRALFHHHHNLPLNLTTTSSSSLPRVHVHHHRGFSLISIHTAFPASLLRLQQRPASTLLECSKSQDDTDPDDQVLVSDEGLIHPRLSKEWPCQCIPSLDYPCALHSYAESYAVSNGPTFMPNTFTMQEFARMALDQYLESHDDGGRSLSEPVIYSVRKGRAPTTWHSRPIADSQLFSPLGTPIPAALTLLRMDISRFSLQPSNPVSVKGTRGITPHHHSGIGIGIGRMANQGSYA